MGENKKVIGGPKNFWLLSEKSGYDLNHPATPTSPAIYSRIALHTSTSPITIAPNKTALVVIDLQNYFLSPALGRPSSSPGPQVVEKLTA